MPLIHPLFRLIASRPHMIADHVEAYSDLVADEMSALAAGWKRRAILGIVALACAAVAIGLGGIAIMLWAAIPTEDMPAPWVLLLVPGLPLLGAVGCIIGILVSANDHGFKTIRDQFAADVAMLREVSSST
jgi:peptidoglycan/LPS O-acetylase OafA/YrhL